MDAFDPLTDLALFWLRCKNQEFRAQGASAPPAHIDGAVLPRFLIFDKVFELYRHFQRHPVLQPSIGRVNNNRVLFFDGQHKVAALLWTGRREFECKIYLAPDIRLLNETNIAAHDKFSQTRFYASIMVLKLGTEFGLDF